MQECTRNPDSLFLTAGEGIAQLPDFRVVSMRKCQDKLMDRSLFRSLHNLFPRRPGLSDRNIISDRIMEQIRLLGYVGFISRRFFVLIPRMSFPEIRILPPSTSQKRIKSFNRVDLPEPLAPWIPTTFPFGISME